MEDFEYGEQFDIEQFMHEQWQKELQQELDFQILERMIPRYKMKVTLDEYKSDYNNCNLKDYKDVKYV